MILGPRFEKVNPESRLDRSDADYVECVHTSINCYGLKEPVCTADFYPNFGFDQPSCGNWLTSHAVCDHARAHDYYAESISGVSSFKATKCKSFLKGCNGDKVSMGGYPGNMEKGVEGIFYLQTNKRSPYGVKPL